MLKMQKFTPIKHKHNKTKTPTSNLFSRFRGKPFDNITTCQHGIQ